MPRPRTRPITNTALADRILETGLPYERFATEVNAVAKENGYITRYNRGSIANWLTGRTPLPEVIPIVVETVSRHLGNPYTTPEDLGWTSSSSAPVSPWTGDPTTWLDHLGRCDMTDLDRRAVLGAGLYSLTAAMAPPVPARPEALLPRVGVSDAARITEMTTMFSDIDDRFGGGHARNAVAAYLTGHVVPLLRKTTNRARPSLFTAAGELAYLTGFMAADAQHSGLAQRYYIQAVRLADEAGNRELRAKVLRAMALQAVELGHPFHALDLAEAAARAVPTGGPARLRAWVTGMQAEAQRP